MGEQNSNGLWGYAWKFNMALMPFGIALMTWMITQSFAHDSKLLQLEANDKLLESNMQGWVMENFPTDEVKENIKQIQQDIQEIKIKLAKQ